MMEQYKWPQSPDDEEIDRLRRLCAEWEAKAATWMASPEAAQRLAGYREMGQRTAKAEQQRDELLEALKDMKAFIGSMECEPEFDLYRDLCKHYEKAKTLIDKVENEK